MIEPQIDSFIVKIWIEEHPDKAGQVKWRGYIVHVPSSKRVYLKSLNTVAEFIAEHLLYRGVDVQD